MYVQMCLYVYIYTQCIYIYIYVCIYICMKRTNSNCDIWNLVSVHGALARVTRSHGKAEGVTVCDLECTWHLGKRHET